MLASASSPIRDREKDGGREREREIKNMFIHGQTLVIALPGLFLFLKGMTGALAPFSYLVIKD
jgi:hypothetical protein